MDWVGILVERATGQKLGDYMQQHIFEPLGITEMSFLPTESMKKNLAYMNQRAPDGTLHVTDHPLNRSLTVKPGEDLFHSGGGGLFGKPQDYCSKPYPLTLTRPMKYSQHVLFLQRNHIHTPE